MKKITTTTLTPRRHDFRDDALKRDGPFCVATGEPAQFCDATHLAPKSKGDDYILAVFNDRSTRYNSPSPISGINDIQNGLLLAKTLHAKLAYGSIALIKTPNFGLEHADIVRVDRGSALNHITLQQLKAPANFDPTRLSALLGMSMPPNILFEAGANLDILFQGTGTPPPSVVILDYMYGVAAFKCWGIEASRETLRKYYESHYKVLLAVPNPHSGDDGADDGDSGDGDDGDDGDDLSDADYDPNASQQYYSSTSRGTEMATAMDKLNAFLMSLHGTSPEDAARRWEKRMEEKEQIAQQASRNKVMEWMRTVEVGGS